MTMSLAKVQQFLDSDNPDGARDAVERRLTDLTRVNAEIRDFAALLALGTQQELEIALGVLARKLLNPQQSVNSEVLWLLLAAVLSRSQSVSEQASPVSADSPARISILGLTTWVKNWESPLFALLTPALDAFFLVSLSQGNSLIAEQTLDFIATEGENYAKAPRTQNQLQELQRQMQSVLDQVDDLEIKEEWSEGLEEFVINAHTVQYTDENIWSAAKTLVDQIYSSRILKQDENNSKIKEQINRFITASLAALGTIFGKHKQGLSVAVRIDSSTHKNSWSVGANVIDKIERLFQEVVNTTSPNSNLPTFIPAQAIPGSWTILLHINISQNQSNLLTSQIASLFSIESQKNEQSNSFLNSWQDYIYQLKQDDLQVDIAFSHNTSEHLFLKSISTEDRIFDNLEESVKNNLKLLSHDVPQADNFERILDFASLLIQYPTSPPIVKQKFLKLEGVSTRQFAYYRRAIEILGLADERVRPTPACFMLKRLPKNAKIRFLAYQFISSNLGLAWFNWQDVNDLSELQPEKATEFLKDVCPSLSGGTIKRRSKTLQCWLKKFQDHW
ncbi:hypothetical protein PN462_12330 [Spirulina sp. CS-785/01]|uniref:hypothetical protein n=1 Tax=Spirulina sp. CS-785/01 TaxID=3021716 RepID=UPI00232B36B3|nr:hypothetical protein [Spirulina sp. CS-785/01]MDB9313891.1 hypothetical protein [Spirulina sp. CS-785/01]